LRKKGWKITLKLISFLDGSKKNAEQNDIKKVPLMQKMKKKININLNCKNVCGNFSLPCPPRGTSRRGISQMFHCCRSSVTGMKEKNTLEFSQRRNNLIFMTLFGCPFCVFVFFPT
jgi:hypothetical protein